MPGVLRTDLLLAVEAPEQEDRLCLSDGPRLPAIDSERMVQPGDRDLVYLCEQGYEVGSQFGGRFRLSYQARTVLVGIGSDDRNRPLYERR